ncbi:MAG: oxygen-independent coproporphyrinogen III oxidase [Deltaproteobacteria bacterium]|nr:oxygen-independent coproporphyrinogen III oxidase [Deltaproteobacteria bacterium]
MSILQIEINQTNQVSKLNMSISKLNDVTPEMIQRYNRPGPRYTSYPTVPIWDKGHFHEEYIQCLQEESIKDRPISLYVHLPFCRQLCTFCGCNKFITSNRKITDDYLSALCKEIEEIARIMRSRKKLAQIHLGGGTPTFFNHEQLEGFINKITSRFELQENSELAFEADPRVTNLDHLETLYKLGFRRVSFGVQDLNSDVQMAINRNQTSRQSWDTINNSRSIGYTSINLDLVYGLPLQTYQGFCKTLNEVGEMRPDRLAIYSFAYLPGMFKTHKKAIKEKDLPVPEEKIKIYLETIRFFTELGYVMIGMDHYALPEDELTLALKKRTLHRNFMGYTTLHNMAQIGVGVSAISDFGGSYWQNDKDLHQYINEAYNKTLNPHRRIKLDKEDQLRREVIETLMCHGEISIPDFENRYKISFRDHFNNAWLDLEKFAEEGLVQLDSKKITLTPVGALFTRNIVMPFDRYLKESSSISFSKTV